MNYSCHDMRNEHPCADLCSMVMPLKWNLMHLEKMQHVPQFVACSFSCEHTWQTLSTIEYFFGTYFSSGCCQATNVFPRENVPYSLVAVFQMYSGFNTHNRFYHLRSGRASAVCIFLFGLYAIQYCSKYHWSHISME